VGDVILDDVTGAAHLFAYGSDLGYQELEASYPALPGRGMWIAATDSFTWTMDGTRDLNGVSVPVQDGWTLMGYPLWFTGDLYGVKVDHDGTRYDFADAVNAGLVSGFVYDYDAATGGYVTETALHAWHGYWFAGHTTGLSLWFDYQDQTGRGERTPLAVPGETTAGWSVNVSLIEGPDHIVFGMSQEATDGFDADLDEPRPPASPAGEAEATFALSHPEWNLRTGDYFRTDYRLETQEPSAWTAEVQRDQPGDVHLYWDRQTLPEGRDFQVYLPDQNRVVVMSMREQGGVTLQVGNEPLVVQFRTPESFTDTPGAEISLNLHNAPNPFNPSTEFRFNLQRAGNVEVRVYSIRGELVRTLSAGVLQPGPVALTWWGRNDRGAEVASGAYFYRLFVDGRQEGPTLKMTMVK
jgi:hypothetical protein